MKAELTEKLLNDFPNLYKKDIDPRFCFRLFGFEVGNGWFDLLYRLSAELESEILKMPEEDRKDTFVSQVKEKYAGLRFYGYGFTQEMEWIIDQYCDLSYKTCEVCGKLGRVRGVSWYNTLCEEHTDEDTRKMEALYKSEYEERYTIKERIELFFSDVYYGFKNKVIWPIKYPNQFKAQVKRDVRYFFWKLKRRLANKLVM